MTASNEVLSFDVEAVRADFPVLSQEVYPGKPLVYLDTGASAQTPKAVIDAITGFYARDYSNIHRGVHALSQRATSAYEAAREKVRAFLNAASVDEIVFVRGTTEAINLVAHSYAANQLRPGDEVVVSHMEHHSNIVPWQMVCEQRGASVRVLPIDDTGQVDPAALERIVGDRTRIVAITHMSNALGTITPAAEIVEVAHRHGVPVLFDGAQSAPHMRVDVQALDCDFYAFSGHKLYGPTGVGVLYAKKALLDAMPPWQGGGDMIREVRFSGTTYADPPARFEAGTPNIAGGIGLGAAIDYLAGLGLERITTHEQQVLRYATERLSEIDGLKIIGTAQHKAGVLSFVLRGVHPHDAGTILDREGIAVRVGHHCAQPVMDRFQVPATIRASLGLYNTTADIDALVRGIHKVKELFGA